MNPGTIIDSGALWLAIPVAMLAGLISFLSPCAVSYTHLTLPTIRLV